MPYPNEHAARLRDPGRFDPDTYRRKRGGTIYGGRVKVPSSIAVIWGKLKGKTGPDDPVLEQTLRFPTRNWTAASARAWCKRNKVKYILFEPASKKAGLTEEEERMEVRLSDTEVTHFDSMGLIWGSTLPKTVPLESKRTAEKARRTDRISLMDHFYPISMSVSPLEDYRKAVFFHSKDLLKDLKEVLEDFDGDFLPVYIQKKHDGVWISIHKQGSEVKVFSEDGIDRTSRFPDLPSLLKDFPEEMILLAELERWSEDLLLSKQETLDFLNSSECSDETSLLINAFDLLWIRGLSHENGDVHLEHFSERMKLLGSLPFPAIGWKLDAVPPGCSLSLSPSYVPVDLPDFMKKLEEVMEDSYSDGAVVKLGDSSYPLSGISCGEWKLQKYQKVTGKVWKTMQSQWGNYEVHVAVDVDPSWRIDPSGLVAVDGDFFLNVGKMKTSVRVEIGDVVVFKMYQVKKSVDKMSGLSKFDLADPVFHLVLPPGSSPDSMKDLERKGLESGFLQFGDHDSENTIKSFPHLGSSRDKDDPFCIIPDEKKSYRFSIHNHFKGRSVWSELHIESGLKKHLLGWNLSTGTAGILEKIIDPIMSKEDALKLLEDLENPMKINWSNGNWMKDLQENRVFGRIVAEKKSSLVPLRMLKYEGVTEGDDHPDVMVLMDKGEVEFGMQGSGIHEYFLKGDVLKYRIVIRKDGDVWYAVRPVDQTPLVLSSESLSLGFAPPPGISALPKEIMERVPSHLQYWRIKHIKEREEVRRSLISLMSGGELDLVNTGSPSTFVLHKRTYGEGDKGITDIRLMSQAGSHLRFTTKGFPFSHDCKGEILRDPHSEMMVFDGGLPPGHYLAKGIPGKVEVSERGDCFILQDTDEVKRVEFFGDKLYGVYDFKRDLSGTWTMKGGV